jgi:hypothetical protein
MENLQERIIQLIKYEVDSKYSGIKYRLVPVGLSVEIMVYWGMISDEQVQSLFFTTKYSDKEIDDQLKYKITQLLNSYKPGKIEIVKTIGSDIICWIKQQLLFSRAKRPKIDFLISLNDKKHILFTQGLKKRLEDTGFSVKYFLWESLYTNTQSGPDYVYPRFAFPRFWKKAYREVPKVCLDEGVVYSLLKSNNFPHVIVVEGDDYSHHLFGHYSKVYAFDSYCLQWGYLATTVAKPGLRNMPFTKFLVWGDFFREAFQKFNPGLNIVTTGHLHLNPAPLNSQQQKIILFAVQKVMPPFISAGDLELFIQTAVDAAKSLPDYTIRIRSHPNFSIPDKIKTENTGVANIEWQDYYNHSLHDGLKDARFCVTISSTLGWECINYGTIPIYLKVNDVPLQLHADINELSPVNLVCSPGNLLSTLESINGQSTEWLSHLRDILFKYKGEEALKITTNEITSYNGKVAV